MTTCSPKTPHQLFEALKKLAIPCVTVSHAAAKTVEDSRAFRGDIPGRHCKNLFLKDKKGALWLVVTDEHQTIDLKQMRKRLGVANLSFGKPELLFETLGVTPGSVTPFAVINDVAGHVTVVVDQALLEADRVSFHPLVNTQTTTISGHDLGTFLHATNHAPIVIDFSTTP
ncbi:prolyl-tRNA synthetase associated domain-containing protein [Magnetovibrio sp.]|uniref:prolyl-tRNA synthetase associated domain-containing protein n=1 Tax=Magnetovibrio sp. TaxID=2024836 RepID=UPI002F93010B